MRHGAGRAMQAFLARDDVWVSVVVSGQEAGAREEALLHTLLDSLKFTDTSSPTNSFDFYHKGRLLYLRKDYRRAAEALSAGLDLERRERRLDKASWRNLVINLVDSYAASRELARAKAVLDFGVAEDPTNPVFHMALARYHAMQNDLDNAIASLEKAYLNRDRRALAAMPLDPLRDPAFERFRKDERFRKAVKTLKK
jgi:tetratricopeptide (TPR) repeat protein